VLEKGVLNRRRAVGKLKALETRLLQEPLAGNAGIGHTRWATHGKPSENNAHPHATDRVAVVHNGIIENFRELREKLTAAGVKFGSETDTEVIAHLVTAEMNKGRKPVEAVAATLKQLRGAFALAFLFAGENDLLIGARKGSPLAIGHGNGEMFLGSDAIALAPFTNKVTYLEDGDWAVLTRSSVEIFDSQNRPVKRAMSFSQASAMLVDKGNHRHFMAKEIAEQPEVIGHTLAEYVDFAERAIRFHDIQGLAQAIVDEGDRRLVGDGGRDAAAIDHGPDDTLVQRHRLLAGEARQAEMHIAIGEAPGAIGALSRSGGGGCG